MGVNVFMAILFLSLFSVGLTGDVNWAVAQETDQETDDSGNEQEADDSGNEQETDDSRNEQDGSGFDDAISKPNKSMLTGPGFKDLDEVSTPATNAITSRIGQSSRLCIQTASGYYVDCLGERLGALAAELPKSGEYAEARKIIHRASKKLRRLAKVNRDTTKPRIRIKFTDSKSSKTTKTIRATAPELNRLVRNEAEAILLEAQTLLLRSVNSSQKRKTHYQQISAALGSETKVLLRSL